MIAWNKLWLVAGMGLATMLPAQETGGAKATGPERSVVEWIQELGSASFKERVAAEKALREIGKDALPALENAAESSADSEVQWRARRLVRQIEKGVDAGGVEQRVPPPPQQQQAPRRFPDARDQFEDVFRRMERDFGVDIPRGRFFRDEFFRDLDAQFREMDQRMRALRGGLGSGVRGMQQGMSMQVGPDGVRVEVQEKNEKGEVEKKVYEAPDMETFQKQYGDLLKEHGLGLGGSPFGITGDPNELFERLHQGRMPTVDLWGQLHGIPAPQNESPAEPAPPAAGRERLGIYVRPEIPAALREYLALDEGVGLMVESVQEGTLAERLGLQAGDIVTRIGERQVGTPGDVQAALSAIETGADVAVQFVRKGQGMSATAAKPAAGKPEPGPLPLQERPRIQRRGQGRIR